MDHAGFQQEQVAHGKPADKDVRACWNSEENSSFQVASLQSTDTRDPADERSSSTTTTRTRRRHHCEPCLHAKIRCNGEMPCGACQRRRTQQCMYKFVEKAVYPQRKASKQKSLIEKRPPYRVIPPRQASDDDICTFTPMTIASLDRDEAYHRWVSNCNTTDFDLCDHDIFVHDTFSHTEMHSQPRSIFPELGIGVLRDDDITTSAGLVDTRVANVNAKSYCERTDSSKSSDDNYRSESDINSFNTEDVWVLEICSVSLISLFKAAFRDHASTSEKKKTQCTSSTRRAGDLPQLQHRSKKRKLSQHEDSNEKDEDDNNDESRPTNFLDGRSKSQSLLARPFHKYDCYLFGPDSPEPSYHVCGTAKFVHVAHLKQHLQRTHAVPKIYCYRCCRSDFSTNTSLKAHMRAQPACEPRNPPLYTERIDQDLAEILRLGRKNDTGVDKVDYWNDTFDKLFPGIRTGRKISPFFEGPGREFLNTFLSFGRQSVGRVIENVVTECQSLWTDSFCTSSLPSLNGDDVLQEAIRVFDAHIENSRWPKLTQLHSLPISPESVDVHPDENAGIPSLDSDGSIDSHSTRRIDTSCSAGSSSGTTGSTSTTSVNLPALGSTSEENTLLLPYSDAALLSLYQQVHVLDDCGDGNTTCQPDGDFERLLAEWTQNGEMELLFREPTDADMRAAVQAALTAHDSFSTPICPSREARDND